MDKTMMICIGIWILFVAMAMFRPEILQILLENPTTNGFICLIAGGSSGYICAVAGKKLGRRSSKNTP